MVSVFVSISVLVSVSLSLGTSLSLGHRFNIGLRLSLDLGLGFPVKTCLVTFVASGSGVGRPRRLPSAPHKQNYLTVVSQDPTRP